MPEISGKQYRAMAAAKAGNSTLDIPQSVGKEFVDATPFADRSKFAKKPAWKMGQLHGKSAKTRMLG